MSLLCTPAVLVFVADVSEIGKCVEALANMDCCITCPLHGNSSAADKRLALRPATRTISKIIVATNVAETSITIDGVKFVINYGMEKSSWTQEGVGFESVSAAARRPRWQSRGRHLPHDDVR